MCLYRSNCFSGPPDGPGIQFITKVFEKSARSVPSLFPSPSLTPSPSLFPSPSLTPSPSLSLSDWGVMMISMR